MKKKPASGTWDEDNLRMRAPQKREKRESGKSWRDYTADEDLDPAVALEDAEGGEPAEPVEADGEEDPSSEHESDHDDDGDDDDYEE